MHIKVITFSPRSIAGAQKVPYESTICLLDCRMESNIAAKCIMYQWRTVTGLISLKLVNTLKGAVPKSCSILYLLDTGGVKSSLKKVSNKIVPIPEVHFWSVTSGNVIAIADL